jgi:hypothetical protein
MNCMAQTTDGYDVPALAGAGRFLLGLLMMIFGLYVGFFFEEKGHGLALLLFFASPFVILKNEKRSF